MTELFQHPAAAEKAFPTWGGPADRLRFFLGYAVLAPSRHNTQPWTFEIEGDEVRVYSDASRALPSADPDGRELVMACGAAILNLRLAAAHFGFATTLEIVPGHRRDGLLATVHLEERRASTPEVEELFRAIPTRRTNRLPLDGREPPEGLVAQLIKEARREGAWLRAVEEPQRRPMAELIAEGDRVQWGSARFRSELAAWTRMNGSTRRDGLPGYAQGLSDAAALLAPVVLRFTNPGRAEAERDRRRATGSKALLVLATPRDGKHEWLQAGEAMQRILLRAASVGLSASYFCQPIELPELRRKVADVVGEPGAPQLILRLGYGLEVRAPPRRPVDAVLRRLDERPRRSAPLAVRTPTAAVPAVPAASAIAKAPPPGAPVAAPTVH
jgi:nitroreductase